MRERLVPTPECRPVVMGTLVRPRMRHRYVALISKRALTRMGGGPNVTGYGLCHTSVGRYKPSPGYCLEYYSHVCAVRSRRFVLCHSSHVCSAPARATRTYARRGRRQSHTQRNAGLTLTTPRPSSCGPHITVLRVHPVLQPSYIVHESVRATSTEE
jgi:hypothetical protein